MSNSDTNIGNAISDSASSMMKTTGQALDGLSREAQHLAQRSSDLLQERSAQLRKQAAQTRDATLGYIQQEPVKAVLYAAAAGAALVILGSLLSRNRD
jgi:ElaB/YqjD/DUF883 family membrane-anchored ribosome-binding protein